MSFELYYFLHYFTTGNFIFINLQKIGSECRPENHRPVCYCPYGKRLFLYPLHTYIDLKQRYSTFYYLHIIGYVGDPYIRCTGRK